MESNQESMVTLTGSDQVVRELAHPATGAIEAEKVTITDNKEAGVYELWVDGQTAAGLLYNDAAEAVEWRCRVFGFSKRFVVPGANGAVAHAHLVFGNGGVMLSSAEAYAYPEMCKSPRETGGIGTAEIIVGGAACSGRRCADSYTNREQAVRRPRVHM